jgi:penicillin-binding protein 1A
VTTADAPLADRPRVVVGNRAPIGVLGWVLRLYAFIALVAIALVVIAGALAYRYIALTTPPAPDLSQLVAASPGISRTYAADGTKLDEFALEWRHPVPYDQIPPRLIDAVIAIEDHEFFEHRGIYWKGIVRAAWRNVVAGDFEQGGSTITQQVAKQLVGSDKSLSRKAHEAVLAMRLERRNSKKAILAYYLNQIYLGGGAYGVAGAAERYFGKRLDELTLAEMALIAGLPKAPSAFSPLVSPERAIKRRNTVLDQMVRWGKLDAATADAAKAEPLKLAPYDSVFPDRLPYYANHIRTALLKHPRYGYRAGPDQPAWVELAGLRVETAAEPSFEAGAYDNVDYGTRKQDKRQGWRGPVWYVDGPAKDTLLERQRQLYGAGPLTPGRRYLAVVDDMGCDGGHVLIGDRRLELPLRNLRWAFPWSATDAHNDKEISCATRALKRGDVVWVRREIRTLDRFREFYLPDGVNPAWQHSADQRSWDERNPDVVTLEQVPHPQGALFTADHRTGYVTAMVGGYDFTRNEFNRTNQACRQPGSTYKPIYYSAAIDDGFGFDSMFYDRPVSIVDPVTGEVWTPTNLHGTVDNDVTLEYALVFSKNIPSVAIFSEVGADRVEQWARRLGFTSKIIADKALALGASCTYLDELSRAFAIFARNGRWIDWTYVRRVLDRHGNVPRGQHRAQRPDAGARRSPRPAGRPRRRGGAPGHPGPDRVSDLEAPGPDGQLRLHQDPARDRPPRRRQDRDVERDHGHLVRRLHLALRDRGLAGRRQVRPRAGQARRRVHDGRAAVGSLHVRGRLGLPQPRDPLGGPARGRAQGSRRAQPRPTGRRDEPHLPPRREAARGRAPGRRPAAGVTLAGRQVAAATGRPSDDR